MITTEQFTPDGACHGACNHRNRTTLAAYQRALEDHADATDTWYRNGQKGDPPAEPTVPDLRWYPGNPLFCARDVAAARRSLLELDTQAAQLAATSDGHRGLGTADGKVSGSKTTSSVSPVADILDRMLGDLLDAEDEWRQLRGYASRPPAQRGPRGSHPRSRTIGWLADHLADMLAHPDFLQLPRTIYRWERVLRHLTKDDRTSPSSPIRCPRPTCGERRVSWDDERHYYACGACGNVLYQDEHDQHEREQAEAAEAARLAAGPPPAAVQHRPLTPRPRDDGETRTAGTLPVVDPIRIDPDTYRLIFRAPYNRPLTEAEWPDLPWPTCPACGGRIRVQHVTVGRSGRTEVAVGSRTLPAFDPWREALPGAWRCAGHEDRPGCGATGHTSGVDNRA
ncbi:hypothetical protein GCM10009530_63540 [Microbispora corallina]|uniref:GATA-type domain-containing protein n=1 Tax=Microbispora corallina TaxID=83302 RepID=A0ABQ4GBF5_9ACTN|nr:hypothetical protein [Microbispora corallina]GIH44416.1 hypothetical protein Mco01_74160 [Microbispora corallina]